MKNPPPACPETVSCFPFTLSFQRNKTLSRNRRSKPRSQTNLFIEYTIFRTGCRRHPNITSQITIRNPNCLRIRETKTYPCFIHIHVIKSHVINRLLLCTLKHQCSYIHLFAFQILYLNIMHLSKMMVIHPLACIHESYAYKKG